jgi:glutaredoxin-related protein
MITYHLVKVDDENNVVKYPYLHKDLKSDYPNTTFGLPYSENIKEQYNFNTVEDLEEPEYNNRTQKLVKWDIPRLVDGQWVIGYDVVDLTSDELNDLLEHESMVTRSIRNGYLKKSDWVVVKSYESGETVPQSWLDYRQELRDITDHANFPYLNEEDWPVEPEV